MRIVSWNINSLRRRQERFLGWLAATQPDVVCLQETKCTDEQFPVLDFKAAGYHSAFHGQKSYNGVAILSRAEPTGVRPAMCDEEEDPQARVIAATIGELRVYSIYAPNGQAVGSPAYDYKMKWYGRLRNCLQRETHAAPLVVCGDFNVAPQDVDVYDPDLWRGAIMCSDGERKAFEEVCAIGLVDTLGRSFAVDILRLFMAPSPARTVGPAIASMLIYLLMAVVLYVRPAGLFPAKGR